MVGGVIGNYRILRRIGEGGMGVVYLAEHALIGRQAAIKVLLRELSWRQDLVTRFFNEARAATAVRHPGIVEIYDFGYHTDGSAYIVMEHLEGEALSVRLRRTTTLPEVRASALCRQVAGALTAAHAKGIVHRDLKPDNIYIVRDPDIVDGERTKILDFGIAKLTAGESAQSMTRTGSVMGTPPYMSPEQCKGAGAVDHRTDLYALGCILFEMVCGRPPFVAEGGGEIMAQHIYAPPPLPSSLRAVTPQLEHVILRALAKEPSQRFQSADEMIAALQGAAPSGMPHAGMPEPMAMASQGAPAWPTPAGPMTPAPMTPAPMTPAPMSPAPRSQDPLPPTAIAPTPMPPTPTPPIPTPPGPWPPGSTPGPSPGSMQVLPPTTVMAVAPQQTTLSHASASTSVVGTSDRRRSWRVPAIAVAAIAVGAVAITLAVRGGERDEPIAAAPEPAPVAPPEAVPPTPSPSPPPTTPSAPDDPTATPGPSQPPVETPAPASPPTVEATTPASPAAKPAPPAPPAHEAVPAAPMAKPAPPRITLKLTSDPAGADVYVMPKGVRIGRTPFKYTLDAGDAPVALTFKKAGYSEKQTSVPSDRDSEHKVVLAKVTVRSPPATSAPTGAGPGSAETTPATGTLDPFEKLAPKKRRDQ